MHILYTFCSEIFNFSDPIWVILCVDKGGVLGVTQQLNSNHFDFHNKSNEAQSNPFDMGMVRKTPPSFSYNYFSRW